MQTILDMTVILREIEEDVKKRGLKEEIPSFEAFQIEYDAQKKENLIVDAKNRLKRLQNRKIVLKPDFSASNKKITWFVRGIKKLIYKMTFFLFHKLIDDINDYNRNAIMIQEKVIDKVQHLSDFESKTEVLKQDLERIVSMGNNTYMQALESQREENELLQKKIELLEIEMRAMQVKLELLENSEIIRR